MKAIYISYDGILEPLGQSQILPYLKGMTARGMEFILVSFEKAEQSKDKARKRDYRRQLKEHNIKWINLAYHKRPQIFSTFFDIFWGFIVCLAVAVKERPEFVHARSYVASLIALGLKRVLGLKFIFDMRGFWADERVEGRLWPGRGRLYYWTKSLEKRFFRSADEIIVLTRQAREIIRSWGYATDNVSVIPCCTDTHNFRFNSKFRCRLRTEYNLEDKFVFIHSGSLEYWYMIEEMLNFFKTARSMEPRAHFLILTRSDKDRITQILKRSGLQENEFTILSIEYSDMPQYLAMVDAGIIFITPVFSKRASSPTKFAEYLSCSLPVIINPGIGDMEECVVKNNIGVVIRDFNSRQYSQAFGQFLNLLKDEQLKSRCRQTACADFDLKAGVEKYYNIYSKIKLFYDKHR